MFQVATLGEKKIRKKPNRNPPDNYKQEKQEKHIGTKEKPKKQNMESRGSHFVHICILACTNKTKKETMLSIGCA